MVLHFSELVIVQTGALDARIVPLEAQWIDLDADANRCWRTQANHIAGVGGNFGTIENDVKQDATFLQNGTVPHGVQVAINLDRPAQTTRVRPAPAPTRTHSPRQLSSGHSRRFGQCGAGGHHVIDQRHMLSAGKRMRAIEGTAHILQSSGAIEPRLWRRVAHLQQPMRRVVNPQCARDSPSASIVPTG